jgi:hypothetical protein
MFSNNDTSTAKVSEAKLGIKEGYDGEWQDGIFNENRWQFQDPGTKIAFTRCNMTTETSVSVSVSRPRLEEDTTTDQHSKARDAEWQKNGRSLKHEARSAR